MLYVIPYVFRKYPVMVSFDPCYLYFGKTN